MPNTRKQYDTSFKLQVVLESYQRDMTIEKVRIKYALSPTVINKWRSQFKQNAHLAFTSNPTTRQSKPRPQNSPDYLKKVIGDLTVENSILKKAYRVPDKSVDLVGGFSVWD